MSKKKLQPNGTELKTAIVQVLRAKGHFPNRPAIQTPSNAELEVALRAEGLTEKIGAAGRKTLKPIAAALGVIVVPTHQFGWAKAKPAQRPAVHPAARADFLETFEWRRLRMEALKLYGRRCMCCGATPESGAVMNVDHIKPRKVFPELALEIKNLQILCNACNHGKGNWDMTDWRPAESVEPSRG